MRRLRAARCRRPRLRLDDDVDVADLQQVVEFDQRDVVAIDDLPSHVDGRRIEHAADGGGIQRAVVERVVLARLDERLGGFKISIGRHVKPRG